MSTMSETETESSISRMNYQSPKKDEQSSEMTFDDTDSQYVKKKVITRDLIRDIYISREKPHTSTLVTSGKLSSIQKRAIVVSNEEKQAIIEKKMEEKRKRSEAGKALRLRMQNLDVFAKKNTKLSDLEKEQQKKMDFLREKANELRQENEDEIKNINEFILAAKVQAIRDMQMSEKVAIKQQHRKADLALDDMMEQIRVQGLDSDQKEIEYRRKNAYEAAEWLQEQIRTNSEKRVRQKENTRQAGEIQQRAFEKMRLQDKEATIESKMKKREFLIALQKENKEIRQLQERRKEQSKQEDIKIAAIQRHKAEKEEAEEKERKEKIHKREIETARMMAQQEKARDTRAEMDALKARRNQEEKEREYRKKEKEAAIKNQKVQDDLRQHRALQLKIREDQMVRKAEQDNQEFAAQMQKRNDEIEKEAMMAKAKRIENLKHNDNIQKQMAEKEHQEIINRIADFQEHKHKKQEDKMRSQCLTAIQKSKVDELLKYDISDNYIAHIQRKFGLHQK